MTIAKFNDRNNYKELDELELEDYVGGKQKELKQTDIDIELTPTDIDIDININSSTFTSSTFTSSTFSNTRGGGMTPRV